MESLGYRIKKRIRRPFMRFYWRYLSDACFAKQKKDRIAGNDSKYLKLKGLKGIKTGNSCVIVGNGPSLKVEDLESISKLGIDMFGANRLFSVFEQTSWRPTYYCFQDHNVYEQIRRDFETSNIDGIELIFITQFMKSKKKNCCRVPVNFYDHWINHNTDKYHFSNNAYEEIADGFSVTIMAIQLAYYMGYSKVYLIGCDNSYKKQKHFYTENDIKVDITATDRISRGFEAVREFCDKTSDFDVYNISRGGELEIFPRISMDDFLRGHNEN